MGDRIQRDPMVVTQQFSLDLTNSPGDKATTMVVPGDGCRLIDVSYTIQVDGTGSGANHELILEAGTGGAGVAISGQADLDADGGAGLTATAKGLAAPLTRGVAIQVLNAESASITVGAIVNVVCLWQM